MPEETVSVRYMINDVPDAIAFHTKHFGFTVGKRASEHRQSNSIH